MPTIHDADPACPGPVGVHSAYLFRERVADSGAALWVAEVVSRNPAACGLSSGSLRQLVCRFTWTAQGVTVPLFSPLLLAPSGNGAGACTLPPQLALAMERRFAAEQRAAVRSANGASVDAALRTSTASFGIDVVDTFGAEHARQIEPAFPPVLVPGSTPFCLMAATMVRNERDSLVPWIAYHLDQGFQHFVIYDDRSEDDPTELLAPLVGRGIVTVVSWGRAMGPNRQVAAMEDFRLRFADYSRLVSFFDVDEYYNPGPGLTILQVISRYLNDDPLAAKGQLIVPWAIFGSSGHEEVPEGSLMIEAYTKRHPKNDRLIIERPLDGRLVHVYKRYASIFMTPVRLFTAFPSASSSPSACTWPCR